LTLGAATLDGYRRQVINDKRSNILEDIRTKRESMSEEIKVEYEKIIADNYNNTKNKGASLWLVDIKMLQINIKKLWINIMLNLVSIIKMNRLSHIQNWITVWMKLVN
jgi:hypothetical protein